MSHDRMSASSVAHKSTRGTLQSLPEPVDPVGNAPDYLTFKAVAPLRQAVFSLPDSLEPVRRHTTRHLAKVANALPGVRSGLRANSKTATLSRSI